MKQLSLILVGGGDRGNCYLKYLINNKEKFNLAAIAEPVKEKRESLKEAYNVPDDMCFESYEELLNLPKMADIAMICTPDRLHYAPAMMAIDKKYDVLLEKPIAPTPKECFDIVENANKNGVRVLLCHVLRYTQFYKTVKKFISEGKIGEVMNAVHTEEIGNIHFSHSFVRGNCRRADEAALMFLAKCCHDTDLFQWLLDEKCMKVQSLGTLSYFTEKNMPKGASVRCTDGCVHKDTCFYYAPSLYRIDSAEVQHFRAIAANKFNPTDAEVDSALMTSPYGRCVFKCDNDAVDHQIVNMQFGENKYVTLTMSAFNKGGRTTTFMGTKGEMHADMENQSIKFYDFKTRETSEIYNPDVISDLSIAGGHGGGDEGIMADLYDYIALDKPSISVSDITESFESHLICFAAEEARKKGITIDMEEYIKDLSDK